MAKLVFGMNVSLDGYVDHDKFAPGPELFAHWTEHVRSLSGSIYGRHVYELMKYWDEDQPDWSEADHAFAKTWRDQPKWVVSRTLDRVGPNATLISGELDQAIPELKARLDGEVDVSGPQLAHALSELGLIDEYRLYLHPVILGQGRPFFAGPQKPLRFAGSEMMDDRVIRLTYVPT